MAVDQLLRKNFWIAVLPLIGTAAFLNAQAVTQLVGMSLTPEAEALAAPPPSAKNVAVVTASARNLSADPILSRNPFDHVTGPLNAPPPDESSSESVSENTDPWTAPACDGVKVLVIAASADKDWSFAAVSGSDGKAVLRRRGEEFSGKRLEHVGWDRVWFTTGGSRCQAQLFKSGDSPARQPTPEPVAERPTPPPTRGGAPAVPPDIAKGIQKVSATEFNIDRAVVDKILENQSDLMRQARIVPVTENGKTVGINLFGLRPDTLLGVLGMENGDRLQTINGFDMASPEKALEAYARLRTADKLVVQVNRRGQNLNLDYNIK
jgi:general secretion pathway protein C